MGKIMRARKLCNYAWNQLRFAFTIEQARLLSLIFFCYFMIWFLRLPSSRCLIGDDKDLQQRVWFERSSQSRWNHDVRSPCFVGEKDEHEEKRRQQGGPWTFDHPCAIERLDGIHTKPFPIDPKKSILLIEHAPDAVPKMAYQVMNTLMNLPPDWRIQIVYPEGTRNQLEVWLQEYIQSGQVQMLDVIRPGFQRFPDYNNMMRSTQFWSRLWGDWVLIVHTDSGICPLNSEFQLEDFFCYDSIGAPWTLLPEGYPLVNYQGGNGGFTLRRRLAVMEIIEKFPMNEVELTTIPEDVWYHSKYLLNNNTLPSMVVSSMFSLEASVFNWAYGWHKLWVFEYGPIRDLFVKYHCPEMQALWDGNFYANEIPYSIDDWPNRDYKPTWGLPKRIYSLLRIRSRPRDDDDDDDNNDEAKKKSAKGKKRKKGKKGR